MTLLRRRGAESCQRTPSAPLPTTSLFAQFVAGQGETLSSGRLTQWNDQSGNGWNATPSPSQPYSTTDYVGRRAVRFYSVDTTGMTFAASHSFSARNVSVFMAARSFIGNGALFGLLNYGGNVAHLRWTSAPVTLFVATRNTTIKPRLNPAVFGFVSRTTAASYSNYETVTGLTAVTNDTDCAGATIGQFNGVTPSSMDLYEVLVYEGSVSNVTDIVTYLSTKYRIRTTDYRKNITFEGDSITAGLGIVQGQSYPLQVMRRGIEDWRMSNLGISGSTIASMTARATSTDSMYESGYLRNILVVLIGRNDVGNLTPTQMYTDLVSYVQARVTTGWEVWVGTGIATGSSLQTDTDAFNAKIRGTDGPGIVADAGANRVVDFAANPVFDAGSSGDTTYYQGDSTHPTAAGAAVLADIIAPKLLI